MTDSNSGTVCRRCGRTSGAFVHVMSHAKGFHQFEPTPQCTCGAGNCEPLYKHEKDCGLIKFVESPVAKPPAEGPRPEIGQLYCDLTAAISHLLGLIESKGLEGWQIGFAKQVVRNVETQYFGYPPPVAQPSPDAAKVEEIAEQIVNFVSPVASCWGQIGRSSRIKEVAAILCPYFSISAAEKKKE